MSSGSRAAASADGARSMARSAAIVVALVSVAAALLTWATQSVGTAPMPDMVETAAGEDADPTEGAFGEDTDGQAASDDLEALPVVTYDVYLDRDPFDPVVPEEVDQTPTGTDPADTDADPDPDMEPHPDADSPDPEGDPDDETAPDNGTAPEPDDGVDECAGDEEIVCDGRVVSLQEIARDGPEPVAVIQVDTTIYEVRPGEAFAQRFRLLTIEEDRVTALFGDTRFSLPLGESVLK